jgi:hypothetical protein
LVLVAFGVIEQDAAGQAEDADELQQRKAAAGFLAAGLGISPLVLRGVGQAGGGAVDEFDSQAVPEVSWFFGDGGGGDTQPLKRVQGQSLSGLAISTGASIHTNPLMEAKECLDLTNDFAAGAIGIEHLIEKAKEGAPEAIDAIPTVAAFLGLGQQVQWQQGAKEQFQVGQALLTKVLDASAQGGQASSPGGEERGVHDKYVYLSIP